MIHLRADRSLIRGDGHSRRYLSVELRAPEAPPSQGRLPVNLAFVIDRSGSMHGEKLANACKAVVQGIRSLHEGDRFAVVAYDERVTVVVPTVEATAEARESAVKAVERMETGGSTALHAGWEMGCRQIAEQLQGEAVARCLLLTDGLANAGLTDHDEIVRQCAGWRDRRVVTTTFGLGADFDETLLRRMSDTGGGNFQFIESAAQIADFVASEVGEALAITVREGVLVVDAGGGAVVESLNDFPCRGEEGVFKVAIGSLYGGQTLAPILRVTFPEGMIGSVRDVTVHVEDLDGALGGASASARFTWASHADNDAQPRDRGIDRAVATLYAARAERDALERNQKGDFEGARQVIEACVARIRGYAGDDPELLALAANLELKARRVGRAMDRMASKTSHSLSSMTLRGRVARKLQDQEGTSQRSVVHSEWEAMAAVAQVLKRLAAEHPGLLKGHDIATLAADIAHLETRGCLLDLSNDATGELKPVLRAADLCGHCRSVLEAAGVASAEIQRLVEALRVLGAPSGVLH